MSVSIICACKNRKKPLSISLASWIQFDEVDEIIITDWNSDDCISDLTRLDNRIKIIRVENEPYFNQPQPLNLAASLVKSEYILKLDCDHILNPYFNFFDYHKPKEKEFIVGYNSLLKDQLLHPLWGLLYVKKSHFNSVGGYNEHMGKYYAVEDDELTTRLISFGLTLKQIKIQKLSALHIPHSDKDRIENFESFNSIKKSLEKRETKDFYSEAVKVSKFKNFEKYPNCAKMLGIFTPDDEYYMEPIYKWKVTPISDQVYEAIKI